MLLLTKLVKPADCDRFVCASEQTIQRAIVCVWFFGHEYHNNYNNKMKCIHILWIHAIMRLHAHWITVTRVCVQWMDVNIHTTQTHAHRNQMRYNIGIQHNAIKIHSVAHTPADKHSRTIKHTRSSSAKCLWFVLFFLDRQIWVNVHTYKLGGSSSSGVWIIIEPWRLISIYQSVCT